MKTLFVQTLWQAPVPWYSTPPEPSRRGVDATLEAFRRPQSLPAGTRSGHDAFWTGPQLNVFCES